MTTPKPTWTPGPWNPDRGCVRDADGLAIASPTWADRSDEEIEANARLIAAAPAMYKALREIRRWTDPQAPGDVWGIARDALRLAEGGES